MFHGFHSEAPLGGCAMCKICMYVWMLWMYTAAVCTTAVLLYTWLGYTTADQTEQRRYVSVVIERRRVLWGKNRDLCTN